MIDISKDIAELTITSDEDFNKAMEIIHGGKIFQYTDSSKDKFKDKNVEFKKIQKLVEEINSYFQNVINKPQTIVPGKFY